MSAEEIHRVINGAADAYQNAGHVTGSELDSAAYHGRFLRHLTALDAMQQHSEKGFRAEGVPSSFSQGLPPIRASQSVMDGCAAQRHGMTPSQLAPLSIPGASQNGMHGFSAGPVDYSMDSAVRTGFSQAANRTSSSYPAMPPASESDQQYFDYMFDEVALQLSTPAAFAGNGAMGDYGYPSSRYREAPPMSYGHGRNASYQPIPPMHYPSNGYQSR